MPMLPAAAGPRTTSGITFDDRNDNAADLAPGMQACPGASGSCLTLNDETCCVGVLSWGYYSRDDVCNTAYCDTSAWSALSSDYPLNELWDAIDFPFSP